MKKTSEAKIRLLLKTEENSLRKFYWIERTNNDLYWGSSAKSGIHIIPFTNQTSLTFQIPNEFDLQEKVSSKFSFHESGKVHHKIHHKDNPKYDNITHWCALNEIVQPKGFFAIITKNASKYELFTKAKPDSGNVIPIIFNVKTNSRYYFEFFLSTDLDISAEEPIIKLNKLIFNTISIGINEKMHLIIRCATIILANQFSDNRELGIFKS